METLEAIRTLRSVRTFAERPVPEETIHEILNAGRRSQSSKNTQPWQFVVVRDRELLVQLAACGQYAGHLAGAAFAVAIFSTDEWAYDIGQASAYMQLAAWDRGVGSCIASIYEPAKARAILGAPDEQFIEVALSFGYPAQPPSSTLRRGGRRPLDEVVRWDRWG
ncbi:MAG TPA: nitroreductase family protein [Roseiflexaceae bacterium]|nr:nitroreductase family protein [Roseiflexaceae bacterium]HMP42015.1 nitroreductase family protein [Roseiflexaceae bacterium]